MHKSQLTNSIRKLDLVLRSWWTSGNNAPILTFSFFNWNVDQPPTILLLDPKQRQKFDKLDLKVKLKLSSTKLVRTVPN